MVKLVVAYGAPEDTAAFDEHYASTHRPLVDKIPNLRRFEAGKVLGTPDGTPAPYYYIAELYFDDPDQLQAAMGSVEGQAAGADVATFASGGATLMIAETEPEGLWRTYEVGRRLGSNRRRRGLGEKQSDLRVSRDRSVACAPRTDGSQP